MFSRDIELKILVLYFCNSVQNNSPTKLPSNEMLELKVRMLSVNILVLYVLVLHITHLVLHFGFTYTLIIKQNFYKHFQMLIKWSPPSLLITLSFCFLT